MLQVLLTLTLKCKTIAKHSQDKVWIVTINKNGVRQQFSHKRIRRVSMDKFYEIVFGEKDAFFKICKVLPTVLDDVIASDDSIKLHNTVYDELDKNDFYKSLYLLAFKTYEGFDNF